MSDEDRRRWNERYGAGAYQSREHPGSVLLDWKDALTGNSALDLACGRGRNAIHLATLGFEVDAIDISDMAIQQATRRADTFIGLHTILNAACR